MSDLIFYGLNSITNESSPSTATSFGSFKGLNPIVSLVHEPYPNLVTLYGLNNLTSTSEPISVPVVAFFGLNTLTGEKKFIRYPAIEFYVFADAPAVVWATNYSDGILPTVPTEVPSGYVTMCDCLSNGSIPMVPTDASAVLSQVSHLSDGDLPYWPYKAYPVTFDVVEGAQEYYVTFFVAERVKAADYNVGFFVAQGRTYDVTFQVQDSIRSRNIYDQIVFNVMEDVRTTRRFDVTFSVVPGVTTYDVEFTVLTEPTRYEVTFDVAAGGETVEYDIYYEVIEFWVPVTLRVTTNPSFPGNIPPSSNKHRLNVRVIFGDILGGAGYATYLWKGPDNGRVQIMIEDIPDELGAEMRVIVYNDGRVVIDSTGPAKPIWEGYFNGTA